MKASLRKNNSYLPEVMRLIREFGSMDICDLAAETKFSEGYIKSIEDGEVDPSEAYIKEFANVFGIKSDVLDFFGQAVTETNYIYRKVLLNVLKKAVIRFRRPVLAKSMIEPLNECLKENEPSDDSSESGDSINFVEEQEIPEAPVMSPYYCDNFVSVSEFARLAGVKTPSEIYNHLNGPLKGYVYREGSRILINKSGLKAMKKWQVEDKKRYAGSNLKKEIHRRGISQKAFALRSGIAQSQISKICTGKCDPRKDTIDRIRKTLETIDIEQLEG